ncbi:MAG: patatin-like phospholipase family protein [Dehalococcoidia bacterium]|jgi:NTE family protein
MIDIKDPNVKIGLALGSGGARGLAHIGVIKALLEAGIPIHMIAGTSMGALIGACYAADTNIALLEDIAIKSNLRKLARLLDPKITLLSAGILHGGRVENFLKSIMGDKRIEDCEIPYSAVATDVRSGKEVILNKGPLLKAVRASISIPVVFVPVKYGSAYLVDGGTVNPVPANVVRSMGATFIIAVNVLNDVTKRRHFGLTGEKKSDRSPSIFNTMIQSVYIMEYQIIKASILKADIIIEPDVGYIEAFEFHRGPEAIEAGYNAAAAVIPEIQKLLSGAEEY